MPQRLDWLVGRFSPRQRYLLAAATGLLIAAAVVSLLFGVGGRTTKPPTPPAPAVALDPRPTTAGSAVTPPSSATVRPTVSCRPTHGSAAMGAVPVRICIPSISVDASIMELGLNPDRTVQVPPLSRVGDAGWYQYSAMPGAVGPTVILGHVDSAQYGDGVFFRLGQLRAGDQVAIAEANGSLAIFRINSVAEVPKSSFPTQSVYGPTSGPAIRLITCGGRFDAGTRNYLDNIIAYGTLETGQPAG